VEIKIVERALLGEMPNGFPGKSCAGGFCRLGRAVERMQAKPQHRGPLKRSGFHLFFSSVSFFSKEARVGDRTLKIKKEEKRGQFARELAVG